MTEDEVIRALGALAQASRLRVFRLLVVAGPAGATPGSLSAELGIPPSSLSAQLKELANAGLVSAALQGRSIRYSARFDTTNALLGFLTANCCGGQPCLDTASLSCAPRAPEEDTTP